MTTAPSFRSTSVVGTALLLALASCAGGPSDADLRRAAAEAQRMGAEQDVFDAAGGGIDPQWYRGPGVIESNSGPARFVPELLERFDTERAYERVVWLDRQYRAPANEDYDRALDALAAELREAGYGERPGLELEIVVDSVVPAWTPVRASIELLEAGADPVTLHAFDDNDDVDRVMLPIQAPSASLEAEVALDLNALEQGMVLVTDAPLRQVEARAQRRGAVALVSSSLGTYNVDPTGADRHLDAIQYRQLRPGQELPVFQISKRTHDRIAAAVERGGARLRLESEVRIEQRPRRTLIATIVGAVHPDRVVGISSHLHEPGANDNASGVATMMEVLCSMAEGFADGSLGRPASSISIVLGDEFDQTSVFLEHTERTVLAGISADMTGESRERTGAIALLERMPDPGALATYLPDEHTPWGAGEVDAEDFVPNGLAVIARCAMVDVGLVDGAWPAADHPWEGGSDHDVFIDAGVPAVLFWHFTDFAYHTSLDRLEMIDADEMKRTGAAVMATALGVADATPADLDRYLRTLDLERSLRVEKAEAAEDFANAGLWRDWCFEARVWLRALCLDIPIDEARPPRSADSDG